jgi:hypothetical protein
VSPFYPVSLYFINLIKLLKSEGRNRTKAGSGHIPDGQAHIRCLGFFYLPPETNTPEVVSKPQIASKNKAWIDERAQHTW